MACCAAVFAQATAGVTARKGALDAESAHYRQLADSLSEQERQAAMARVADTLSQPATAGRLSQVCNRWIYTACLCFGLDTDEVLRSGFGYAYSVYQVEYSRNLLFADG